MSTATTNWILQLVDKITAPLKNIQEQTRRSREQMNQWSSSGGMSIDRLTSRIKVYQEGMRKATDPAKIIWHTQKISEMQKQLEKLKSIPPESFFSRMRRGDGAMGQLYKQAIALVGVMAILGGVQFMIGSAAEAEKTAIAFEVLLKSAEKGKTMVDNITKMASATPYGADTLQNAAKTMLSFGLAQQEIMPNLKAIGNIAMGDANKMDSLTLAFSQMSSTGKLTGQDLLQMINAGFNPLQVISEKTGKSIGDLKKAMSDGAISTELVREAFLSAAGEGGLFGGMMEKMSETFSGKWSAFTGKIKLFATEMGAKLLPILGKAIDGLTAFFQFAGDNSYILIPLLKGITAGVLAWKAWSAYTAIAAVVTKISAASISTAIYSIPIIGWIALAIAAIVALVTYFREMGAEWVHIIQAFFLGPIGWIALYFFQTNEKFRGLLTGMWEAAKTIFTSIGGFIKEVAQGIWHVLKGVFDPKNWFDKNYNIADGLTKISEAATKYGEAVGKSFAQGREKGVEEFRANKKERDRKKETSGTDDFDLTADKKEVDFNALLNKGAGAGTKGKSKNNTQGIGLGGSGGGDRAVTMNVTMNNHFNVASGVDVPVIAEQIFRLINDRMRDAAVTAG